MSLISPTRSMSPPPVYDTLSNAPSFATDLRPYLQLPHLLSLTWLAYPVLSLIFVAFRLQLSLSASQNAAANAKDDLLASCKAAEHAATAAASMPRYLASSTNRQFASAVNGSLEGARVALVLSLTAMESIINFLVDIYRSTFLCFAELVVRGGLAILIGAVQELNTFVHNTANSIRTSIQGDVDNANSAIRSAFSALNRVNPFGNVNPPQFDIPSLSALDNINLPTDFENALISLNNTLPSFSELKDKVNAFLDTPFELLKKDINDTFAGITFDVSLLPIPEQNTLTFCDQLDTSVVDDLGHDLLKVAQIGTIILLLLALLLIAANCVFEWYKWRCLKRHLERTRQAWTTDPTVYHIGPSTSPQITLNDHNLLMLQATSAHPFLTRIANALAARLNLSATQHTHLRWFFHYVFHPPALACFLIGFFGLLSVQLQLLTIAPLEAKFSQRAAASVSDFSNVIVTSVNNNMLNQSSVYANGINSRVDTAQTTINDGLFGWVNGTTTTLNNTLNEFYDDVQNIVTLVFNGTILENPARDFVNCIIGSKVDALEEALTFLNENLKVDIPRVNQSILVLSPSEVNEATQPIAEAALGGGQGNKDGVVGRLVNTYVDSLKKERIMFGVFMGLWGIVVLMALAFIFWQSYGKKCVDARGRRKWKKEQRTHLSTIIVPFREQNPTNEKGTTDLPAFTPMPSPAPPGLSVNYRKNSSDFGASKSRHNWDEDSFGASRTSLQKSSLDIGKPRKLMAIGRGSLGVERLKSDANKPAAGEQGGSSWYSRLRGVAHGKSSTNGAAEGKSRPNLRIAIDRASVVKLDGTPRSGTRDDPLASAWSASPPATGTRILPWTNRIAPASKPDSTTSLPYRPKVRPMVSLPSSVSSVYEDAPVRVKKSYNPTPLAVPLHLGFEAPPQAHLAQQSSRSTLAPPPDRHRRSSSVPVITAPLIIVDNNQDSGTSSTPVTRLLTTTHARSSSSINPFSTPFDDEHRVGIAYSNDNDSNMKTTNPFTFAL